MKVKSESEDTQLCQTLSDSMGRSQPGSSIHGIFQARVLEWGAIAFSNWLEWPPSKSLQIIHTGEDVEKKEYFYTYWECKLVQPLWKTVWRFLQLNTKLHYNPPWDGEGQGRLACCSRRSHRVGHDWATTQQWSWNPTPGHISRETTLWKEICTPLFVVALFTMARYGSNLNIHQQRDGQINNRILLSHKREQNDAICVLPVVRFPGRERRLLETMQLAVGEFITDLSQGLPPSPRVWGQKGPEPQFSPVLIRSKKAAGSWRKRIGYTAGSWGKRIG